MLNSTFTILALWDLRVQAWAQRGKGRDPGLVEVSIRAGGVPQTKVTNY